MSNPIEQAIDGLTDILNGWKYIRDSHGDLYGVGWDRAQEKAEAALSALQSLQGVELPDLPPPFMAQYGRVSSEVYAPWAEQMQAYARTAVAAAMARGAVAQGHRVFLVATGELHEGEETYTRHDDAPPPLCDAECLYVAAPNPEATQPDVEDTGARCEPSDWVPPAGYDGDGSVEAMACRATQPTQAEAPSEPGKVMLDVQGLTALAGRAQENDNPIGFFRVMLQWAEQANAEIARLRAALATQSTASNAGEHTVALESFLFVTKLYSEASQKIVDLEAALATQQAGQGVPEAMKTVISAMQSDPDYAWSWHCNVAMAFVDAGGSRYTANQGAARFMRLLANIEPAHELPAASPTPPAPQQPEALAQQEHVPLTKEQIHEMALQEQFLLICDDLDAVTEIVRATELAHHIRAARSSEGGV